MNYGELIMLFKRDNKRRFVTLALSLLLLAVIGIASTNQAIAQDYCTFSVRDPATASNYHMAINQLVWDNVLIQPFDGDPTWPDPDIHLGANYHGYLDHTDLVIDVFRGTTYGFSVLAGFAYFEAGPDRTWYYSQDLKIYIDWDQDGDFNETDELVFEYDSDGSTNSTYEFRDAIDVPSDATVGLTRMRIICDYNTNPFSELRACDGTQGYGTSWGEGRDYGIRIAPGNDAGAVAALVGTGARFAPGTQPVKITIRNYADKPLQICTIQWWVDGVPQPDYLWTGALVAGEEEEVEVGSYDFILKSPVDYYEIDAQTDSPNGVQDEDTSNDRLPNPLDVAPALMPGDYSIGTGQDFENFTELQAFLGDNGIIGAGDLNFRVYSDTYQEQFDLSGFQHDNNTMRFYSYSGDPTSTIIEFSPDDPAKNFVFNACSPGLSLFIENITIKNLSLVLGRVLALSCHLDEVFLDGNIFEGVPGGDYENNEFAVIYSYGEQPNDLDAYQNYIRYGSYGFYADMTGNYESDIAFIENDFQGQTTVGYYSQHDIFEFEIENLVYDNRFGFYNGWLPTGAVYSNGTEVIGNVITDLMGWEGEDYAAIEIDHSGFQGDENVIVAYNTIRNCFDVNGIVVNAENVFIGFNEIHDLSAWFNLISGIVLVNSGNGEEPSQIVENNLGDIERETYGVSEGFGILLINSNALVFYNYIYTNTWGLMMNALSAFYAFDSEGYVADNMMVAEGTDGATLSNNRGLCFYYNSINAFGGVFEGDNFAMVYGDRLMGGVPFKKNNKDASLAGNTNNTVMRNLIINSGIGEALEVFDLGGTLTSDYNDIYSYDIPFDLAAWQAQGYGEHSVSIPVSYESMADLHLTQFDPLLFVKFPLTTDDPDIQDDFEPYDWDDEERINNFYFGVDNLRPRVFIVEEPEAIVDCYDTPNHMFIAVATATLGSTPEYQWLKNGDDLDGETAAVYYRDDLTFDMSGVYRCRIKAAGGDDIIYSDEVLLYVLTEPAITRAPDPVYSVDLGGSVMVEVQAHISGDYPREYLPTVQWKAGGSDMVNDDRIAGAASSILAIINIDSADYRNDYTVTLTGRCGEVTSDPFEIAPIPGVNIITQPVGAEECEGGTIVLTVEAEPTNGGQNLTYQWKVGGIDVSDNARISGSNSNTLTIINVQTGDAGDYTVAITVTPGDATVESNIAAVTVKTAPVITAHPQDVAINVGMPFDLIVEATGADSYQWQQNGTDIAGETSATFTRPSASLSDAGTYHCVVSNVCGDVVSDDAEVTITMLQIIAGLSDVTDGGFTLLGNSPNPFNNRTTIEFIAPAAVNARISLTDILGNEAAVIFDDEAKKGINRLEFNVNDMNLTSGVYYYTLTAKGCSLTKKMVIVK